ncbi:Hsp20/alpha crystallin family protein [Caldinitratiruptor microaerophilus]|uniref:SHSP domain-containing protein n=1 Tax=Caldinitratiruptor microaerophilus TaxID=671077 RepID=A0AA35CPC4_9FIRM|nr:Hsp20/alpha crystallin family protein [Caldinitratiruptor microaerophilus]BDG61482.1 hypothetical protein caldi_25720 [Caldinitratiruptor microaerophilus]
MHNLPIQPWPGGGPDSWFAEMRRDLESLAEDMTRMLRHAWGLLSSAWPWAPSPAVQVDDLGSEVAVRVHAPGFDPASLDVRVGPGAVYLAGRARQEYREERPGAARMSTSYGEFRTLVPLPAPVDTSRARATYDGTTIDVRVPKLPQIPIHPA